MARWMKCPLPPSPNPPPPAWTPPPMDSMTSGRQGGQGRIDDITGKGLRTAVALSTASCCHRDVASGAAYLCVCGGAAAGATAAWTSCRSKDRRTSARCCARACAARAAATTETSCSSAGTCATCAAIRKTRSRVDWRREGWGEGGRRGGTAAADRCRPTTVVHGLRVPAAAAAPLSSGTPETTTWRRQFNMHPKRTQADTLKLNFSWTGRNRQFKCLL